MNSTVKLKKRVKAQWVAALRSGEYEQGMSRLRGKDDKFCCLGVLCELAVKAGVIDAPVVYPDSLTYFYGREQGSGILPEEVQEWAFLKSDSPDRRNPHAGAYSLAEWNDGFGTDPVNFNGIADLIEEHL